jgi:DNA replication protein DnaC
VIELSERWSCPVRDCRFVTPILPEDVSFDLQDELHRHLRTVHNLDEDWRVSDDVALSERRRRETARLQHGRDRMRGWTLDSFPAADVAGRRALRAVRDWFEDAETWARRIFIYGPPGTGKTGLAYALCWRWLHLDLEDPDVCLFDLTPVLFCNMRRYLAEQQARMSRGEGTDFEPLLQSELVVLDDLGAERPTAWALDKIALTIEGRYETNGILVVTSNYSPPELAQRLGHEDPMVGQRLVSRLTDGALVIRLDRRDLRARSKAGRMSRLGLERIRDELLLALDGEWRTPTDLLHRIGWSSGSGWYVVSLVLERLANDGLAEIKVSGKRRYFRRAA